MERSTGHSRRASWLLRDRSRERPGLHPRGWSRHLGAPRHGQPRRNVSPSAPASAVA